jgi:hypothetical protein
VLPDRERSDGIDCAFHLAVDEQLVQEFDRAFDRNSSGEKSAGLRWHECAVGWRWDDIATDVAKGQAKCHVFRVARDGASEFREISAQLTARKVVAAGASPDAGVLAIGSMDGSVALVSAENYQAIGKRATFQMPDGFLPIGITFGPAENELTLSSWFATKTLNMTSGEAKPFTPPTFRDKFIRRVVSSGIPTQRLVATALYGRVKVARIAKMDAPAEPIVLRETTAVPQFSRNGTRLLTLSGGVQNALDTLRVSDVSMLNDSRPHAGRKLQEHAWPDLAR